MRRRLRLLCTALAGAAFALSAAAPTAAADAPRAGKAEGVFSIGIPKADDLVETVTRADPVREPAPALVQTVWDLGAGGDWDAAEKVLRALQAATPGWQPPANLTAYLAAGKRDAGIRAALTARDWSGALALIPAPPATACEAPFHLWARAEATEGLGAQQAINEFYLRALTVCTEAALAADLAERSLGVLDAEGLAAAAALPALTFSPDARVRLAQERLARAADWHRFQAALATGDLSEVRTLAAASRDPRLLAKAGWAFLEAEPARASGYFETALAEGGDAGARRGLVLATLATGDLAAARAATAAADPTLAAELGARIDLAEAARRLDAATAAYNAGDYAEARRLSLLAADHPEFRRAGLMRAAWSDLQLGADKDAAAAFGRLYAEMPDTESAEGYALAAQRTDSLDAAAKLARTLGGPLGKKVEARYAAAAFDQGDYLAARMHAPESYPALEGLGGSWYRQAISARRQGGTPGESRLSALVATTSAGTARGADRFEAGVSLYTLDAGGSARRETFAAPYAAWSREGETSLAARIGLLPIGGGADTAINAEAAVARDMGGGAVEARAFIRPKTESVLAMAGQPDGTGDEFGRVTETGVRLSARLPVGRAHAVQVELAAASLDGEGTAGNTMIAAGLAASRSFDHEGFAYLVTGPFYQYQSYDRNTNFFTPGHGGYFSPQDFHRAGWSVNAQTAPLKDWIVRANAAAAYETVEEDPAPVNPLLPGPQPFTGGSASSGLAGAIDLSLARRVTRNVIFSANVAAIVSQAYEDVRLGFALTWVPGGRAGLVRNDLPADPFTPATWVQP